MLYIETLFVIILCFKMKLPPKIMSRSKKLIITFFNLQNEIFGSVPYMIKSGSLILIVDTVNILPVAIIHGCIFSGFPIN